VKALSLLVNTAAAALANAWLHTQVQEAEERFRRLAENARDIIYRYRFVPPRGFEYVSPAVTAIIGYTPAEHYADPDLGLKLVHPDDRPLVEAANRGDVSPGTPLTLRWVRKDGSVVWTEQQNVPIYDEAGRLVALEGIVRDITERKRAELLQNAVYRIAQATDKAVTLEELFHLVHGIISQVMPSRNFYIALYDAQQDLISFPYFVDEVNGAPPVPPGKPRRGLTEYVLRTGQSLLCDAALHADLQRRGEADLVGAFSPIWLGVPLKIGEEAIGVMAVQHYSDPTAYGEREQHILEYVSSQVAKAIQRKRAEEEIRRRLAELEAVNRVSTSLRTAQTLDEMLSLLLDQTLAVMDTDAGTIWLYDPEGDLLRRVIARGWFAQVSVPAIKPAEGMAGTAFATGEISLTREFASDSHLRPHSPPGWGGAVVPVRSARETIGVLFVSVPLPREVTPDEARLLTILAEIAGNALQRMRLHAQTERRAAQLAALHAIDQAIGASLDVHITLNVLLDQTLAQLAVHAAAVLLYNPYAHVLKFAAGRGFRTRAIESTQLRLGEGYAGRAALERRLVGVPHLAEAREFTRASLLVAEGFVTYYGAPLIAKGRIRGVLEIFQRAPLEPDPEWLGFLETLAGQAAIAIDNAELFEDLQRSNTELSLAYDATIEGWSRALDLRDKETEGHTQRVTELTLKLAQAMGMSDAERVHLRRGALLHDIGKMGVPDAILLKPGPLTDEEWEIMRKHPVYAYEMLLPILYLRPALEIPYYHHEKWDGTGYPHGLKGEQIPLAARIFAVVDVWDALRSDRPYRPAWPAEKVQEHIRSLAGTHFDPQVAKMFLTLEP